MNRASFDTVPAGWTHIPSAKTAKETEYVASEGVYPAKGGRLQSSAVRCVDDKWAYYRLSFTSGYAEAGYYAVMLQNKEGQDLVDDHYGSVGASTAPVRHEVCFRGREQGVSFQLNFLSHKPVFVENVTVECITPNQALRWADDLYATLPPVRFTAPAGGLKPLARS